MSRTPQNNDPDPGMRELKRWEFVFTAAKECQDAMSLSHLTSLRSVWNSDLFRSWKSLLSETNYSSPEEIETLHNDIFLKSGHIHANDPTMKGIIDLKKLTPENMIFMASELSKILFSTKKFTFLMVIKTKLFLERWSDLKDKRILKRLFLRLHTAIGKDRDLNRTVQNIEKLESNDTENQDQSVDNVYRHVQSITPDSFSAVKFIIAVIIDANYLTLMDKQAFFWIDTKMNEIEKKLIEVKDFVENVKVTNNSSNNASNLGKKFMQDCSDIIQLYNDEVNDSETFEILIYYVNRDLMKYLNKIIVHLLENSALDNSFVQDMKYLLSQNPLMKLHTMPETSLIMAVFEQVRSAKEDESEDKRYRAFQDTYEDRLIKLEKAMKSPSSGYNPLRADPNQTDVIGGSSTERTEDNLLDTKSQSTISVDVPEKQTGMIPNPVNNNVKQKSPEKTPISNTPERKNQTDKIESNIVPSDQNSPQRSDRMENGNTKHKSNIGERQNIGGGSSLQNSTQNGVQDMLEYSQEKLDDFLKKFSEYHSGTQYVTEAVQYLETPKQLFYDSGEPHKMAYMMDKSWICLTAILSNMSAFENKDEHLKESIIFRISLDLRAGIFKFFGIDSVENNSEGTSKQENEPQILQSLTIFFEKNGVLRSVLKSLLESSVGGKTVADLLSSQLIRTENASEQSQRLKEVGTFPIQKEPSARSIMVGGVNCGLGPELSTWYNEWVTDYRNTSYANVIYLLLTKKYADQAMSILVKYLLYLGGRETTKTSSASLSRRISNPKKGMQTESYAEWE